MSHAKHNNQQGKAHNFDSKEQSSSLFDEVFLRQESLEDLLRVGKPDDDPSEFTQPSPSISTTTTLKLDMAAPWHDTKGGLHEVQGEILRHSAVSPLLQGLQIGTVSPERRTSGERIKTEPIEHTNTSQHVRPPSFASAMVYGKPHQSSAFHRIGPSLQVETNQHIHSSLNERRYSFSTQPQQHMEDNFHLRRASTGEQPAQVSSMYFSQPIITTTDHSYGYTPSVIRHSMEDQDARNLNNVMRTFSFPHGGTLSVNGDARPSTTTTSGGSTSPNYQRRASFSSVSTHSQANSVPYRRTSEGQIYSQHHEAHWQPPYHQSNSTLVASRRSSTSSDYGPQFFSESNEQLYERRPSTSSLPPHDPNRSSSSRILKPHQMSHSLSPPSTHNIKLTPEEQKIVMEQQEKLKEMFSLGSSSASGSTDNADAENVKRLVFRGLVTSRASSKRNPTYERLCFKWSLK